MTSLVYIIRIGKFVKVGFTTNLDQRVKSFRTSTAEEIDVLATFDGGRAEERRLHESLSESRLPRGEFFHHEFRIQNFVSLVTAGEVERAWQWLESTTRAARKQHVALERKKREEGRRQEKAKFSAYCAGLVAERKRTLGW